MFDEEEYDLCPSCGYRKEFVKHNPAYTPKKRMRDFSVTYDGFSIVSLRFRDCVEETLKEVEFDEFSGNENYFNLRPKQTVEFDHERSKTRFIKQCRECENFESIVGTGRPAYLKVTAPISVGILRSDLLFASGNEKHPLTIVGLETRRALENCGLKGLEFKDAHSAYL